MPELDAERLQLADTLRRRLAIENKFHVHKPAPMSDAFKRRGRSPPFNGLSENPPGSSPTPVACSTRHTFFGRSREPVRHARSIAFGGPARSSNGCPAPLTRFAPSSRSSYSRPPPINSEACQLWHRPFSGRS